MFTRKNRANSQTSAEIAAEQLKAFMPRARAEFKTIEVLPPDRAVVELANVERRFRQKADPARSQAAVFVTDAELIRRLGVPLKTARAAIKLLDRDQRSGFPAKQALWGGRRYWPAVRRWFDQTTARADPNAADPIESSGHRVK